MKHSRSKSVSLTSLVAFLSAGRRGFLAALLVLGVLLSGCEESERTAAPTVTREKPVVAEPAPAYNTSKYMPEAFRIIQEGLNDENAHVRSKAIEVVIATRHIRLMPKVQDMMHDPVVPVRFLAVVAMGELEYRLAEDDLLKLLKDPDENVRIAACYALVRLGHDQYAKVIRQALASDDQNVRANAAMLLGKLGNEEDARWLWWTLQRNDSSDMVVLQAAESLAMLGDEKIYPKLWTRLISRYSDDKVVGIRAMGALGTVDAKNAIIGMLSDLVPEVRLAAAEQLGKMGEPIGEPEVLAIFTGDATKEMDQEGLRRVKVLAASAIGEIGTKPLVKYLPKLLEDESVFVRLAAAKAVFRAAMKN